ncbi:hypothetical protein A9K55_008201 [Cordyceps militaris]|uniref:Uncharacterized protein n=1 Tax=Cordyceps militaris TaxID=73501 RepID=A0A2H4SJ64_CORMI|nr:hypothetical protein A9K55_008201 [Cordyceps militaris]
MDNVYFPSMDIADVVESDYIGVVPQPGFHRTAEQLSSDNYFANSLDNSRGEWDSILSEFTIDACIQDPGTFNTSLLSTSPVTSSSVHNTPDTVVSNTWANPSGSGEGIDDRIRGPEPTFRGTATEKYLQNQTTTFDSDLPVNDIHQPRSDSAPHSTLAVSQGTGIAAGTIVCSAATLGTSQKESTLVMNASPRHRVSRLPPDIGPDGEIRYLEPHDIPQIRPETRHQTVQHAVEQNVILPQELERHMYYPSGQERSRQNEQIPPQVQMQQVQPQPQPVLQSRPFQYVPGLQKLQTIQQFQALQQPQQGTGSQYFPNQQFYSQSSHYAHPPHYPQQSNAPLRQKNATDTQQTQQQQYLQHFQQASKVPHFQPGMHDVHPVAQQPRQSMPPVHSHTHMQAPPMAQDKCLELYYTADGYKPNSDRPEKPPNTNSHEWLRNRDFRSTWNTGDVYTNWLDTSPNTVEPHVKPFLKKDIKLGMSSQDATKAAITDGFVRGAGWAAKLFLMQIEKEMRESGTMLGYRPHKKVQKAELEQSVVDHIVRTNPPSIHGAQCANVIAWAYDEFYPGVFCQEGSNGRPRGPNEIFEAWKILSKRVTPDQLKPVVFDTSTGMIVMTDLPLSRPPRPPVAEVRAFSAQNGHETAIRIAQFPVPNAKSGRVAVNCGENFFTNPEGPATMKLQQMKRAESMASRSIAKPQGTRQTPKTAEEKKENRNRKADEKIRWTLTGQSRTIQLEHMTGVVSYECSDGEFRILEGQRLEEAKERTFQRIIKQQEARTSADATGINASSTTANESLVVLLTGAEPDSNGQTPPLPVDGLQRIHMADTLDISAKVNQPMNLGEIKRRRVPDDESMPGVRRKRVRQDVQPGFREARTGKEMISSRSLDSSNEGH